MLDIDVNTVIWGIFVFATLKAAVHLGQNYQEHLRTPRTRTSTTSNKHLTQNIHGISTIDWSTIPWVRSTVLNDRAVELSTAKVHDYSDSVPCRSRIHENPRSIEAWKEKNSVVSRCLLKCPEIDWYCGETSRASSGKNTGGEKPSEDETHGLQKSKTDAEPGIEGLSIGLQQC